MKPRIYAAPAVKGLIHIKFKSSNCQLFKWAVTDVYLCTAIYMLCVADVCFSRHVLFIPEKPSRKDRDKKIRHNPPDNGRIYASLQRQNVVSAYL